MAVECTYREVEIRVLFLLMILGASEWPDRAEEVDFIACGTIWKGLAPPAESQNFAKLWKAWGVLWGRLNECPQCIEYTESIQ